MTKVPDDHRQRLLLLFAFALCAIVYAQSLFGGFEFDDFWNIVENGYLRNVGGTVHSWLVAALSSKAGPLRRPISMLSFAANYASFGLNPFAFKTVNLAIHMLNGLLLYRITIRLLPRLLPAERRDTQRARWLATIIVALWLLHPLHVSGVAYIVQRMNELSALFTLLALVSYIEGREHQLTQQSRSSLFFIGTLVFTLLAVLSKENGALALAYAFVIEITCYGFRAPSRDQKRLLTAFFACFLLLPLFAFAGFLLTHAQWLAHSYVGRDFTLTERLYSEARILLLYLLWIVLPIPSSLGLYHDDFVTSTALLQPLSTLAALGVWITMIWLAFHWRRIHKGLTFAVAWFLVGHSMESTILPLELIFEHRNYLPTFGVLMGIVIEIDALIAKHTRAQRLWATAATFIIAGFCIATAIRGYAWGDPLRLALDAARNHPNSPRSQYDAGRELIFSYAAKGKSTEGELAARPYFVAALAADQNYVYPATSLLLTYAGKSEPPARLVADLQRRLRETAALPPSPFLALLTAVAESRLRLTSDQVNGLVTAALDNASMSKGARAMVLNNYGRYQFQILGNQQEAISLTLAATELDPKNPIFRVNLCKLALAIGDLDAANRQLALAENLDVTGLYIKITKDLHRRIVEKVN